MTFQFAGYTLRGLTEADRPQLDAWIQADPHHAGKVDPDFFLHNVRGEDAWVLLSWAGEPVFFFKTQVACRVHIQFGPENTPEHRDANREAMIEGMNWLEAQLAANGFREILFDSANPPLVAMAMRRLGFHRVPGDLSRPVTMSHSDKEDRHRVPMSQEGGA